MRIIPLHNAVRFQRSIVSYQHSPPPLRQRGSTQRHLSPQRISATTNGVFRAHPAVV